MPANQSLPIIPSELGQTLGQENFATGKFDVKVDPTSNVVATASPTGLKLQAPLGGNITAVVTNASPAVVMSVGGLFEVSMPANTDVRIRALVPRQIYLSSEGEYPGGSFTTSTAAIVNLTTAFVPADNNVHVAGEINILRIQDISTNRLFVATVWRLAGIAGNWSGWVSEIGITTLPVALPQTPPVPPTDFFRSSNGATLPDGTNDYTEAITHNGFLGLGITADPQCPLELGDYLRNDVIRLYDGGLTNPHQFYGIGVQGGRFQFQVSGPSAGYYFQTGISPTASSNIGHIRTNEFMLGDPTQLVGVGYWQMFMNSDDGLIRFNSPDTHPSPLRVQAEILCSASSGTGGLSGGGMTFRTQPVAASGNSTKNRLSISSNGRVIIANPLTAELPGDPTNTAALFSVCGSIRLKGGPGAIGNVLQSGGLWFGQNDDGSTNSTAAAGDSDSGISSTIDGRIDIYCNGGAAFTFAAGGVASKAGGGLWAVLSDERTKRNITPHISDPRAALALEPIEFYYNGLGGSIDDGTRYVGFSAQELQATGFSHWVQASRTSLDGGVWMKDYDESDRVLQVDSSNLMYELLAICKMQQSAIEALEARVKALEPKPRAGKA